MLNHLFVILTSNFGRFLSLASGKLGFDCSNFLEVRFDGGAAELEFEFGGDTFSATRNSGLMWFRHSSRRSFLNLERGRSNDWLL